MEFLRELSPSAHGQRWMVKDERLDSWLEKNFGILRCLHKSSVACSAGCRFDFSQRKEKKKKKSAVRMRVVAVTSVVLDEVSDRLASVSSEISCIYE